MENTVIKARLTLTGTSPLVLNNGQLADPTDYYAREMKKLTDKSSSMTPNEQERKEELQWMGSLYRENTEEPAPDFPLIFPVAGILGSLKNAGKAFRLGSTIERAVQPTGIWTAIHLSSAPATLREIAEDKRFRFRRIVNGTPTKAKASKVVAMTPSFPSWGMQADLVVLLDVISWENFERVAETAGIGEGVGNARKLGYGRYSVKATKL